jgi:DNA-binding HxlR family transcriptional regulator
MLLVTDWPSGAHAAGSPAPSELAALAEALALVGDRWSLLVVAALLEGPSRFGELQNDVGGIAPNVLTQRLRQLERDGIVIARPYSRRPARFAYELSDSGRALAAPLRLLAGWGATHAPGVGAPRHQLCGTPMDVHWWCPACEQAVDPAVAPEDPGEELHFA